MNKLQKITFCLLVSPAPLVSELLYQGALQIPEGKSVGSLAIEGDTLFVTTSLDNIDVYRRAGDGDWTYDSVINPKPEVADAIGWIQPSLDTSGDTIVFMGQVFVRSNGGWVLEGILSPPGLGDVEFGNTGVTIDGDVIVVDGRHLFQRSEGSWSYRRVQEMADQPEESLPSILESLQSILENGSSNYAQAGDQVLVGSPWENTNTGAARLYRRVGSGWEEAALIQPSNPVVGSVGYNWGGSSHNRYYSGPIVSGGGTFGSSVAMTTDTLFIASKGEGAIHIYQGLPQEAKWKTFLEGGEWVYDTTLGTYNEANHPWIYKEDLGWIYKEGDGYLYLHERATWSWATGDGWIVDLQTGAWERLVQEVASEEVPNEQGG